MSQEVQVPQALLQVLEQIMDNLAILMPYETLGTQQHQTKSTEQLQENESHVLRAENEVTDNTPF